MDPMGNYKTNLKSNLHDGGLSRSKLWMFNWKTYFSAAVNWQVQKALFHDGILLRVIALVSSRPVSLRSHLKHKNGFQQKTRAFMY